jgi:ribonuclease BN (tRNA processing enzyme)
MKITVVGCGHAFSKINYNQSFLLEEKGRRMILDFGAKIPLALDNLDIDIDTIDDVYVSHLHGDHIGGLE